MSLNSIMNIGTSGLMTAQEQLRITSDNISNVNTPGYIRKQANQQAVTVGGKGAGVTTGQITTAADKYLEQATFKAQSSASQSEAAYNLLDQIQSQFGDITDSNNLFNQMNSALTSVSKAAESPQSSAQRQEVISNLTGFLNEGERISDKIQQVRSDADSQIGTDVKSINDLLKNISQLNAAISSANVVNGDATGAQSQQTQYIDQLSKLIDVKVQQNDNGGVTVRTQSGMVLTGDSYVQLEYQPTSNVTSSTVFNSIMVVGQNGEKRDLADNLSSGELKGLLDVRDKDSVAVNDQLNQYMSSFSQQLNAASNAASAVPAPTTLTGKNTSQTLAEGLTGMTGQTNLVTTDTNGNLTHKLTVTFNSNGDGGGTLSMDGTAAGTFTAGTFATAANSAFSGVSSSAQVGFSNGQMTLSSNSTEGVAVADTSGSATNKLGQGFSQYFGLNDLITSTQPTTSQTGLSLSSASGFAAGSKVSFAVKGSNGSSLASVDFSMPGGTMSQMLSALNDTSTGLGRYGTFGLDSSGTLTFTGFSGNTLGVSSDNTSRNGTGANFSTFFGLGGTPGQVAGGLNVNQTVQNDPSKMGLATVNLTGTPALVSDDGSGGQVMADIGSKSVTFPKSGLNSGGTSTLDRYGSDLAGQVGNLAATAKTNQDSSESLLTEAQSRRSSAEGVNLDEELVNLTTYQQAYSASGRLIQAAKDMFDVLLNMM